MTDRPIIFSAPMVRAILDGRKTQTRRVLKHGWATEDRIVSLPDGPNKGLRVIPHAVGDCLWVREAWRTMARHDGLAPRDVPSIALVSYEADYSQKPNDGCRGKLRSPIHMPRWASRITLEVTPVRVQRLKDISECDAEAEGCDFFGDQTLAYRGKFAALWAEIHGPGAWDLNPWVVAISFERVTP